ncbi:MAG: hypothetical protein HFF93_05555 [Oscillibacter sp.]|uniref:DUF6652 family protein n=1 Tax=Oscillibacter sp. TaxID=1945593 RepID=UPI0021719172|nr:DUF6652 family protein [Oscillibacter sp.]MCI9114656.1 hypothetical protein [Oscillibacter sp.]MCI9299923.1 hypothetical protein [Oscillibacter sp.]MCI9461277.1 hypothetical protein [Oscillibacter sp.]
MKTAKLFLAGMYIHLVLSVAAPIGILYLGWGGAGWGRSNSMLLLVYLLAIGMVQLLGWISVGAAVSAYRRNDMACLLSGWRTLKLGAIPFYILNFLWSVLAWGAIAAASRGIFLLLVPIPIGITWLMVIQSGFTGWLYIRCLRESGEDAAVLHSVCQFLPVLDVLSTLLLLRRRRTP